jgi:hypothetical protein
MFRTEHNLQTGEIVEIPLTTQEAAALEKEWAKEAQRIASETAQADAKETAKADLLARLGITAEEAALLLS